MTDIKNSFSDSSVSKNYHVFRPRYHHIPVQRLGKVLGSISGKVLDVACGTGHSTEALAKTYSNVIGCDISASMLAVAHQSQNRLINLVWFPTQNPITINELCTE